MKMTKLLALLLTLALLSCCFAACGGDDNDPTTTTTGDPVAPPPENLPTSPEEYLAYSLEQLKTLKYEEKETMNKITVFPGQTPQTVTEVSYTVTNGENFSIREDGYTMTYCGGMMYFSHPSYMIKNKAAIAPEEFTGELLEISNKDLAWFQKIKFNTFTMETLENGNKKVLGKGASGEAEALIRTLFGLTDGSAITIDFENIYWEAVIDSEYRMVTERAAVSGGVNYSPNGPAVSITIDTQLSYLYGDEYTVKAPTDADSYTLKSSLYEITSP